MLKRLLCVLMASILLFGCQMKYEPNTEVDINESLPVKTEGLKIAMFSVKDYETEAFVIANDEFGFVIDCFEESLNTDTAKLAEGV